MLLSNKNLKVIAKTKQKPQTAAATTIASTEPALDAYADLLSKVTAVNIVSGNERGHKKRDNSNNNTNNNSNHHGSGGSNISLNCKRKLVNSGSSQYNNNNKINCRNNNKNNACDNSNICHSNDYSANNNINNNKKSSRHRQSNSRNNNNSSYSGRHGKTFNSNNKNYCLSFEQHFASLDSNGMDQYFLPTAHSQGSSSNNNHNNNNNNNNNNNDSVDDDFDNVACADAADNIIAGNMSASGHHVRPIDSWHGPVVADDGGSNMLSDFMLKVDDAANELVIDGCDYVVTSVADSRRNDVVAGDDDASAAAQLDERVGILGAHEDVYAAASDGCLDEAAPSTPSNAAIDVADYECLQQMVDHDRDDDDDERERQREADNNDVRYQFALQQRPNPEAEQQLRSSPRQQLRPQQEQQQKPACKTNVSKQNVAAIDTTTATTAATATASPPAAHFLPICLSNVSIGDCVEYLNDELEDLKVMIVC